jgi:mono/diheme cytochrome c family protein
MKIAAGFLLAIVVVAIGTMTLMLSGSYNVGASAPHMALTHWLLETARLRSIKAQADAEAPASFEPAQLHHGFHEYAAMCVICHGAPGKARSEIGAGLMPSPPDLAINAKQWSRAELFWIIKNGIKMTGMPAFGPTHDDATIWAIVSFVETLPKMTPEQFEKLGAGHHENAHEHHH